MDPILILTGPTAVGKTDLSLELAEALDGEIISADSRQIYKDLDIGTAKPSQDELRKVRHHFISELPLCASYSAGRFEDDASDRIEEILGRGRAPLVVGGSTLYIQALKHGLADIPDVPQEVRAKVEKRLEREGAEALYRELAHIDPDAADSMDPTKTQRLVRALEVYEATGKPLSSYHADQKDPPYRFRTIVLHRDRQELYRRINARVDRMLETGLLDEVRTLLSRGFDRACYPLRTIGYQEPIAHLKGEISYDEMVRLIKRNSRRYAKRQLTWFRRDRKNVWIPADRPVETLLRAVLRST